jgi:hypothetical protein
MDLQPLRVTGALRSAGIVGYPPMRSVNPVETSMNRRTLCFGLSALPLLAGAAHAQKAFDAQPAQPRPDLPTLFGRLYQALDNALSRRDLAGATQVLAPEFTTSDPQGRVRDAQQTRMDLHSTFAALDPAISVRVQTRLTGFSVEAPLLIVRGVTRLQLLGMSAQGPVAASRESEFIHGWMLRNGSVTLVRERVLAQREHGLPGGQPGHAAPWSK